MEGKNVTALINVLIKLGLMHKYYCDCGYKTNKAAAMNRHIENHSPLLTIDHATGKIM